MELFDVNVKLVRTIFNGGLQKGEVRYISFEKGNLPAGVYIGYLKTASGVTEKRIVLTK